MYIHYYRNCIGQIKFNFITKTRLFKYIENFASKNKNFRLKNLIFFIFLLKSKIVGTR